MATLMKSSVVWQFVGGFVLGAVGLVALHPTQARASVIAPIVAAVR